MIHVRAKLANRLDIGRVKHIDRAVRVETRNERDSACTGIGTAIGATRGIAASGT